MSELSEVLPEVLSVSQSVPTILTVAVDHFNTGTKKQALCELAPISSGGVDLIMKYFDEKTYTVAISVKAGSFKGIPNDPYILVDADWIDNTDLNKFMFSRIAIIDQDQGYIFVCDYPIFKHLAVSVDNGLVVNVCRAKFKDRKAYFGSIKVPSDE